MKSLRIASGALEPFDAPLASAPKPDEIRIKVAYAGINRADLLQCEGRYPAPAHQIPGLEVSGTIAAIGEDVRDYQIGAPICALLSEGGYAAYVDAPTAQCLPVPPTLPLTQAAALPEALATLWFALIHLGKLDAGEHLFITGGSSGIGGAAITLARYEGAIPYALAGSADKCAFCDSLGAHTLSYLDYANPMGWVKPLKSASDGGVDVVLDILGGHTIPAHLKALRYGGRLISLALMQGATTECSMAGLLMKNLSWHGMTLRSRSAEEKAWIIGEVQKRWWGAACSGEITAPIFQLFPLERAEEAHRIMRERQHYGKLLLEVGGEGI